MRLCVIHSDQLIFPRDHSRISPVSRIRINASMAHFLESMGGSKVTGVMRIISTSKIRNRIMIIKNWVENGNLLGVVLLKPHSNWEDFSFSLVLSVWVSFASSMKTKDSRKQEHVFMLVFFISLWGILFGK